MSSLRNKIRQAKRVVIKVGSSSLTWPETGKLNLSKMETLVREISSLRNAGMDIVLVSSGAIMVGVQMLGLERKPHVVSRKQACASLGQARLMMLYQKFFSEYAQNGAIMVGVQMLGLERKPHVVSRKQACASLGQARLMMLYQKFFSEYAQNAAQILLTKYSMVHDLDRRNARNTFEELLDLGVIPIVNENDTIATDEIEFGDNDTLSALVASLIQADLLILLSDIVDLGVIPIVNENDTIATDEIEFGDNDTLSALVASLIQADLLILLSDIDGLYDDDPRLNPDANFIEEVEEITPELMQLAKGVSSKVGTGGMVTKLQAARIAGASGCDMIIANAKDFHILEQLMEGESVGTYFAASKNPDFSIAAFLEENV